MLFCQGEIELSKENVGIIEKDLIITFDLEIEAWGPRIEGPPIRFPSNAVRMFYELGLPKEKQLTLANMNGSLAVVHGPAPSMDFCQPASQPASVQFEQYGLLNLVHPLLVLGDGRIVIHKEDDVFLQIYDPMISTFTNSVELTHYSAFSTSTKETC